MSKDITHLSAPVQRLIEYMREHGNKITHLRGGHWACKDTWKPGMPSHGKVAIDVALKKDIAIASGWERTPDGVNYISEIELTEEYRNG